MSEFRMPRLKTPSQSTEELDRTRWAEAISILSYGVRVCVRSNRAGVLEKAMPFFPPGWRPTSSPVVDRVYSIITRGKGPRRGPEPANVAYADGEPIARTPDLAQTIDAFESDLQLYVAETSPRRVFVHSGVVGWRDQAILIPGRSFSGKTTLTAELVKAGMTYYSDEYAVFDLDGRVHHYARPLSVRENGHLERPKKYGVEALGGRAGRKPLPVGMIVVSKYRAGARWRPRRLSPGEGALALLANTVSARRVPQNAFAVFHKVVSGAPVLKSERGEAQQVIDFIFENLGR